MASLSQPAFSGGVISPQTLGRTDQNKYATGLRVCRNAWVTRYGTIENRPGSQFCAEIKDSSQKGREIPFSLSETASYMLEFGDTYFRPFKNGARINVVGAAAYNAGTTYNQGDLVTAAGPTVYRCLVDGTVGFPPLTSPFKWYLQLGGLLEVYMPGVPIAAVGTMQYAQQNSIMTLASQSFYPQQILRYSDLKWTQRQFAPYTAPGLPRGAMGLQFGGTNSVIAGNQLAGYGYDSVNELTAVGGNLALPPSSYTIMALTGGNPSGWAFPAASAGGVDAENPVTLTWSVYTGAASYNVYRYNQAAGTYSLIASAAAAATSLVDTGLAAGAALPAPTALQYAYVVTAVDDLTGSESPPSLIGSCLVGSVPTTAFPNKVRWKYKPGSSTYRVYRAAPGSAVFGYVGSVSKGLVFNDNDIIPNTSIQPAAALPMFATSSDYPAVVSSFQQRLVFANTVNQPQTAWGSRVGDQNAFTVSVPIQDNDALQITIAGRQVQTVRAVLDIGKMVILTSNGEYVANGNAAGAITPLAPGLVAQGSAGCASLSPVVIGNTALFIQQGATRLNDLRYELSSFAFAGKDLTKFATDLFKGRTVVDMAWQKLPHSIVWCVLDNGEMQGMTYIREDEMWSWHSHAMVNGFIENVVSIPEGTLWAVYVIVRRTINGATKRYVERLASREVLDPVFCSDAVFSDCSLTYDGRNTGVTTMTATGAAWEPTNLLTLTASVGFFVAGDVGNQIVFQRIADGSQNDTNGIPYQAGRIIDIVTFAITGYTNAIVVTCQPLRSVPTWAQAVAITVWGKAVKSFSGLSHLEGQNLSILADGNVSANPLDPAFTLVPVTAGAFTLPAPAMVVTAGLPIQMDLQTLPLENASGETIANKTVLVIEACPIFYNSRGGSYGQDFAHLKKWKQPQGSPQGYPVALYTGPALIPIQGTPQMTGQICVRLTDPVPFSISKVVISGKIGSD